MAVWQEMLLLFAALWAVQAAGTWRQMQHYRQVMGHISGHWPDGCVGASASRGMLGCGVVAIVVAGNDQDAPVRQVLLMEGRSVFAKFREVPAAAGGALATLASIADLAAGPRARQVAVAGAVAQITRRQSAA